MKCPTCNEEMEIGEIGCGRAGERFFWAPNEFYKKHYLNPYAHTVNTIKKEGGAVFTVKPRNISKPLMGNYCRKCEKLIIDCK